MRYLSFKLNKDILYTISDIGFYKIPYIIDKLPSENTLNILYNI